MLAIQYLEDSPELAHLSVDRVVEKLRRAADQLEFSHLLIGWHLPHPMLEACRAEAQRLRIRFLRWQPILVGDTSLQTGVDWTVVGASGRRIAGFRDLPEFTFVCPNHPQVHEAISRQLEALVNTGVYQGFFLDRIRFPSPASDPYNDLGCFCKYCRDKAAGLGLDLEEVRQALLHWGRDPDGRLTLALALLGAESALRHHAEAARLRCLMDFRVRSVTDLVSVLAERLRSAAMEVGLDCFSPSLAGMVGQDLTALSAHVDWIKIMTYAHALGPAGLPFELRAMCDFVESSTGLDDPEALRRLGEALGRTLPTTRKALEENGLSSFSLRQEVEAGVRASRVPILAGLELIDIPGVARLNDAQIRADLQSVRAARPAGLSLSWDLRHIPMHRLDLVREVYLSNSL